MGAHIQKSKAERVGETMKTVYFQEICRKTRQEGRR